MIYRLVVLLFAFAIVVAELGWAADAPKQRSSSPDGFAISNETRAIPSATEGSKATVGTSYVQSAITGSQNGGSVIGGMGAQGGTVKVDGTVSGSATGSGINTQSTGRGNRGCTSVGGISGGDC